MKAKRPAAVRKDPAPLEAAFIGAASDPSHLPSEQGPEIAFAGRSNVGKSSLLNRLAGVRKLARVSKTPGRTQQINFFSVGDLGIFVDLPGYGFARVPLPLKARWKGLVEGYLSQRTCLRGVVLLVDLRRGLEEEDWMLVEFLAAHQVPILVGATKADKLARGPRLQRAGVVAEQLAAVGADIVVLSALTGEGIPELRRLIRELTRRRSH